MINKYSKYQATPTLVGVEHVSNVTQLTQWAERVRVEIGEPVNFTCIAIPNGAYAQYHFIRGENFGVYTDSDTPEVNPGGSIKNGFVEGIITYDRFIAIRILGLDGEIAHDKTTTNFFKLEEGGFEVPDYLPCHSKGINHPILLCNHTRDNKSISGVLVTLTNQTAIRYLKSNPNLPAPEVFFKFEDAAGVTKKETTLKFDFAGKLSKDAKSEALSLIASNGHRIVDSNSEKVDYIVASDSVRSSAESMTSKMVKAIENGTRIISKEDLPEVINPQSNQSHGQT